MITPSPLEEGRGRKEEDEEEEKEDELWLTCEQRDMVLRYADLDSHINSDIKALLQPVALLRGGGPEQLVMRQ